jgi:aconitate hydratase
MYGWDPDSTYIRRPPFFSAPEGGARPFEGARVLCLLGDTVTTDDISPAGEIPPTSDAAGWLEGHGVGAREFNTYGSRRGNHEVMMRGTFGNVRLRNGLVPGAEGSWTLLLPEGERMSIYRAAMAYAERGVPLIVLAGKEYGSGSSRDWAAKGTFLLGVRAVLACSFERIHRGNLIGMGVLPLQFEEGASPETLGLTGRESFSVHWDGDLAPRQGVLVSARTDDGRDVTFRTVARLDTAREVECLRQGGILPGTLGRLLSSAGASAG